MTHGRHEVDYTFFDVIDSKRKAYLLGLFCADGGVSYGGRTGKENRNFGINFSQKWECKYVVQWFAEDLRYTGPVLKKKRPNGSGCDAAIYVYSKPLAECLLNIGLTPNKNRDNIRLPLNHVPQDLWPCLLLGYFDGDGTITNSLVNGYLKYRMALSSGRGIVEDVSVIVEA